MDVRGVAIPLSAALLCGVLAGCGMGTDTITSSTVDDLHGQVDTVRKAVADGRDAAALSAAAELRSAIRRLAGSGELNPADGMVLLTQVDRIVSRVEARSTPTPVPTLVPVSEPVQSGPTDKDKGPGKAKDKAKGKDKDKGKDKKK